MPNAPPGTYYAVDINGNVEAYEPSGLHWPNFCATESLGLGYAALYFAEVPPVSATAAVGSLIFGIGDATGACEGIANWWHNYPNPFN
jgi:hypothetical protein